ncbi:phenylalanine--tRNA ligase subunit beta [Buchnera aphidicola (Kurisakia onigurumii)]|uniref:phenylalanine--tRNA ligase subunit beta n=1 Tax=Buchnera aphidicola TaxID=9 RepID=UPI0031B70FA4
MKFSELWLRKWIDNPSISTNLLCKQMTEVGLEVEKIEKISFSFKKIIIGKILKIKQVIIKKNYFFIYFVKIDKNKIIYCITKNKFYIKNKKIAIATNNSYINDKKTKINNYFFQKIKCNGKICSYADLGMYFSNEKYIIFPSNSIIGKSIKNYISYNDNIIKINIPHDRPDANSIFGLAREISIINDLKIPKIKCKDILVNSNHVVNVKIKKNSGCIRYIGMVIEKVKLNINTPLWMKERLRRSSISSQDIITDIINYVCLEYGEPVHIFDFDKIENEIFVELNSNNKEICILSQKIKNLKNSISVIRDKNCVLSLSNNLVFNDFQTNKNTNKIFIGSACLLKKQLNINYLFSKNLNSENILNIDNISVNWYQQKKTVLYVSHLILKICGGCAGSLTISYNRKKYDLKKQYINLNHNYLNTFLGCFISSKKIHNIFIKLGYKILFYKNGWKVFPPYWKNFITTKEEVISDFCKLYKYENIPKKPFLMQNTISNKVINDSQSLFFSHIRIKFFLIDKGYSEIITYSFISQKIQMYFFPNTNPLMIKNPISNDMSSMRLTLWPGLISSAFYNNNRQQDTLKLFEIGSCFFPIENKSFEIQENVCLSILSTGSKNFSIWNSKKSFFDFYDLKGDVESLFDFFGILDRITFCSSLIDGLNPKKSSVIFCNKIKIGHLGILDTKIQNKFNFRNEVVLFELFLNKINNNTNKIKEIKYFPRSRRDISITVSEKVMYQDILNECRKINCKEEIFFNLFDIYQGDKFLKGKKSISISINFLNTNGVLTEKKINFITNQVIECLKNNLQANLRIEDKIIK